MNVSQNNQLASNTIMFVINTLQVGGAAKMIKYVSQENTVDNHTYLIPNSVLLHSALQFVP